ncbi:ATP-binding cassette domain-containing protein [Gilvimarinus sp. F26214L]|uniref:ATP-binding cassette domain-containing protein n=1 Tax=Gilvimarinus sp. DZF01 TaxID=3461371 RepID=UPI0040451E03
MMEAVLETRSVSKSFGSRQAVEQLSMKVQSGEFVALLGPNGAGKTTLFQIISGLYAPDSGEIVIAGHPVDRAPTRALAAMGLVFQQPTVDLDRSIAANLHFHARLHGLPRPLRDQRIRDQLSALDLEDRARDRMSTLSGGNRRRVEVARALLHRPQLLLMDEASVGLDPRARHAFLESIRTLCRQGKLAVLWATHLVDEAEAADRVLVMDHGHLIAADTPARLLAAQGTTSLAEAFLQLTAPGPLPTGEVA